MPMIPMGAAPEEELMGADPMMGGGGPPMGPVPVAPGMGAGPLMDEPEPAPEEIAMMLGAQIAAEADEMHMMVEQAKNQRLQGVLGMISEAAMGAQVMGEGQIA